MAGCYGHVCDNILEVILLNYFYYRIDTIFEVGYKDKYDEMCTETCSAHHLVSDESYNEPGFKKTIYLYGVDHAFAVANVQNYDVTYVRIVSQTTRLECFKDTEDAQK